MRPRLVIGRGKEKALLRRHPWVFSGAVARTDGHPAEGDVVDVVDAEGRWMAAGHYQSGTIICKVLSFDTPNVEGEYIEELVKSAIVYRRRMGFFDNKATNVFRLVHAEGDGLPGLVCDYYGGLLVMQAHSVGMHRLFNQLTEVFRRSLGNDIKAVFDKSSATLPMATVDGYLWGEERGSWTVLENGIAIEVNPFEGQKTGFFIDQRDNRALLSTLAGGCRVLNCFGYTGGFSLAALKGGATQVDTVDISKKAIALANSNVETNFGSDVNHRGIVADVMQYLDTIDNHYDIIVLDPPAFVKSHHQLQQGLKGYRSINQRALQRLPVGGLLMTFSCSQAVSADDFRTTLFTAAANAHRNVRIVKVLPHAADHPVSIFHPEGEYLKGLLLQVE
ncbi:MAG: class I SAM-dependent rRNA methyltransferase [Bacteroidales bacterium]|nr:class I SAM-dependent rRNA methyltransferase [Bacteroidales bacterium]